mgnify:CR=1 FL=1
MVINMKKIVFVLSLSLVGAAYFFWPVDKYKDFLSDCTGEIRWCETPTFGKVPLCKTEDLLNIPSAFYGTETKIGEFGGYFWRGGTKEQDIQEAKGNLKEYFQREAEANEIMMSEIKSCL